MRNTPGVEGVFLGVAPKRVGAEEDHVLRVGDVGLRVEFADEGDHLVNGIWLAHAVERGGEIGRVFEVLEDPLHGGQGRDLGLGGKGSGGGASWGRCMSIFETKMGWVSLFLDQTLLRCEALLGRLCEVRCFRRANQCGCGVHSSSFLARLPVE